MDLKRQAAQHALDYVDDGMTICLGSGRTATYFVELLGERWQSNMVRDILCVPTSEVTAKLARQWNIPLTSLSKLGELDLAVDGADEVDPDLNLVKGLGRALLREKILEQHVKRFVVVVDESKLVPRLCTQVPLPVEIVQFEYAVHLGWLATLGSEAELMLEEDGSPVVTDNGNYLALCTFEDGIEDLQSLAHMLAERPGIVEHGLFLGMADEVIVAGAKGIQILERKS